MSVANRHRDAGLLDGSAMHALARQLFPLPRSITGKGVRQTLEEVARHVPLTVREVPSGTPVLDWEVPPEWNVRAATLTDPDGRVIADFDQSTLSLLGYSEAVDARLPLDELRPHLYSLPERPLAVPYRTSYYHRTWGFCLPHRVVETLPEGDYDIRIDATLDESGSLTYGEFVVPGADEREVLVSTHVCHPSLANDNLSGIVVAAALAQRASALSRRFTYRFLFLPGTIGSISWLAANGDVTARVVAGLVLTGIGDRAGFHYKRSRRGSTWIDRIVPKVLSDLGHEANVVDFSPYGYDERQYCSPGFDLPVGRLGRSAHGEYPEYHTSDDNLDFITTESLQEAVDVLTAVVETIEADGVWVNLKPYGEPQLGKRGLYRSIGASMDARATEMALLWVLSGADGSQSLLDISLRSGLPFTAVRDAARLLADHGLLEERARGA